MTQNVDLRKIGIEALAASYRGEEFSVILVDKSGNKHYIKMDFDLAFALRDVISLGLMDKLEKGESIIDARTRFKKSNNPDPGPGTNPFPTGPGSPAAAS